MGGSAAAMQCTADSRPVVLVAPMLLVSPVLPAVPTSKICCPQRFVLCMQAHFAGASLYEGSEWCSSSDVMHSTIVVQSADARDVSEEEG